MTDRTLLCLFIIINLGGYESDLYDLTTYNLGALYATGRWRKYAQADNGISPDELLGVLIERGERGIAVSAFFERHDPSNCPVYHDAPALPCRGEFEQRVVCAFHGMVNQPGLQATLCRDDRHGPARRRPDCRQSPWRCIGVVGEPYARTRVVACPVR